MELMNYIVVSSEEFCFFTFYFLVKPFLFPFIIFIHIPKFLKLSGVKFMLPVIKKKKKAMSNLCLHKIFSEHSKNRKI